MLEHSGTTARLPTEQGVFTLHLFTEGELEIPVLTHFDNVQKHTPLVRIHSSCLTGDVFHSLRCDCGAQLSSAMKKIEEQGGLVIYLPQEGRGIGLKNKLKAYALQDAEKLDTVEANLKLGFPADIRNYVHAAEILRFFKIDTCILLTNNPLKIDALQSQGIKVMREALVVATNSENEAYLKIKMKKMGHLL